MRLTVAQCKSAKVTAAPRAGLRRSRRSSSSSFSSPDKQQHFQQAKRKELEVADGILSPSKCRISSLAGKPSARIKNASKAAVPAECFNTPIDGARFRRERSFDLNVTRKNPRVLSRTSSCTTIGRKRVIGFDDQCGSPPSCFSFDFEGSFPKKSIASPGTSSSVLDRIPLPPLKSYESGWCSTPQGNFSPRTPSTPVPSCQPLRFSHEQEIVGGDSLIESLPFDVLLRIVCCLQHDDLNPVSQVCKRLYQAVSVAWQYHFCFTTPRRERKGVKIELFPDAPTAGNLKRNESGWTCVRPPTPQAPRQAARPADAARLSNFMEMMCPLELPPPASQERTMKPLFLSSHRVLFNEDELCKAVEENSMS